MQSDVHVPNAQQSTTCPSLVVPTCRIHTVTTGNPKRPLMLLLHGFPELWTMWKHQMTEFKDDYYVAAIDMRGYGESDRPMVRSDCKQGLSISV